MGCVVVEDKRGLPPWEVCPGLYTCGLQFALRREFPVSHLRPRPPVSSRLFVPSGIDHGASQLHECFRRRSVADRVRNTPPPTPPYPPRVDVARTFGSVFHLSIVPIFLAPFD